MKYLFNTLKPKGKAHLWSESFEIVGQGVVQADTYCHMWTTGGMSQTRKGYVVREETDREICTMCKNNWSSQYRG